MNLRWPIAALVALFATAAAGGDIELAKMNEGRAAASLLPAYPNTCRELWRGIEKCNRSLADFKTFWAQNSSELNAFPSLQKRKELRDRLNRTALFEFPVMYFRDGRQVQYENDFADLKARIQICPNRDINADALIDNLRKWQKHLNIISNAERQTNPEFLERMDKLRRLNGEGNDMITIP